MEIEIIDAELSICMVMDYSQANLNEDFCFTEKTNEENSTVTLDFLWFLSERP